LAVLAPILEEIVGWPRLRIRKLFESHGFLIQEWNRVRTDWLTLRLADQNLAKLSLQDENSAHAGNVQM